MYIGLEEKGIRRTIISFKPFFSRPEVKSLSDAQIGRKMGLPTQTVKAMRRNQEVPFDTIRILCHQLECQPGDILEAITAYYYPAKEKTPDE